MIYGVYCRRIPLNYRPAYSTFKRFSVIGTLYASGNVAGIGMPRGFTSGRDSRKQEPSKAKNAEVKKSKIDDSEGIDMDEMRPVDTTLGKILRAFGIHLIVHQKTKKGDIQNNDINGLLKKIEEDMKSSTDTKNESNGDAKQRQGSFSSSGSKESGTGSKSGLQPKLPNWVVLVLSLVTGLYFISMTNQQINSALGPKEISLQEFLQTDAFRTRSVEKCLVSSDHASVYVFLKDRPDAGGKNNHLHTAHYVFSIGSVEAFEQLMEKAQAQLDVMEYASESHSNTSEARKRQFRKGEEESHGVVTEVPYRIPIIYKTASPSILGGVIDVVLSILPLALFILLLRGGSMFMGRGSGGGMSSPLSNLFSIGKSKARLYNTETSVKVTFKDVAGMDEAKEEVVEFVKFLKEPKIYEALGAKIPKGAILSGPPGTGKTLLAKAIAGEAAVPFLSVSGSEFVEMFVGVGSSRVRDLFAEAKKMAPCIVFIDEIDAIGRERKRSAIGGNDERESTLNQLLVEMDGFETDHHVVVLAGTNRPDVLDSALTRPGRFDRHIAIDKPDVMGRKAIYMVHLKPIKLDPRGASKEEIATKLAYMTPGFAGADIANVCNEGALIAARWNASFVTDHHLEAAVERVIAGLEKKSRLLSEDEKKTVAYHEAGHATVGWFLKHADPIMKVTIIPRTSGALGFARTLPSDNYLISRAQLLDRICVTLGGRAAEEIFFGEITSGAQNDLQKVTKWAYDYVTLLGMDEKIGPLSFPQQDESGGLLSVPGSDRKYSEATAKLIDERVHVFVTDAYERTKELLKNHKDGAKALAELLLQKETVHREQIEKVLGARPFPSRHSYDEFVEKERAKNASGVIRDEL